MILAERDAQYEHKGGCVTKNLCRRLLSHRPQRSCHKQCETSVLSRTRNMDYIARGKAIVFVYI
jgi:hypothetical protein